MELFPSSVWNFFDITKSYLLKRGTTWKHLKPSETTWNQLQPHRNCLKPPCYSQVEFVFILRPKVLFGQIWSQKLSSPNSLKFGTGVHCYILISNLMFIFPKFLSFTFSRQIWSQNLKSSKLTEIWYKSTFLYAHFDFNVCFFKIFVIHIFWANFVPKSEVSQINWNLIQGCIATCLLRF